MLDAIEDPSRSGGGFGQSDAEVALRYHVITGRSPDALAERVTTALQSGWQLQGGVAYVPLPALAALAPAPTPEAPMVEGEEPLIGLFCQAVYHEKP